MVYVIKSTQGEAFISGVLQEGVAIQTSSERALKFSDVNVAKAFLYQAKIVDQEHTASYKVFAIQVTTTYQELRA